MAAKGFTRAFRACVAAKGLRHIGTLGLENLNSEFQEKLEAEVSEFRAARTES